MSEVPDFVKSTTHAWASDVSAVPSGNEAKFFWMGTTNSSSSVIEINGMDSDFFNLARNPQGVSSIGWNNNSADHTRIANYDIPSFMEHPLGLTKAMKSVNNKNSDTALSMYNIDGLLNTSGITRRASVWVNAVFPDARARLGTTGPWVALPQQTWVKITTTDPVGTGHLGLNVSSTTGLKFAHDLEALATGLMVWEDGTPEPPMYFDGSFDPITTTKVVIPANHSLRTEIAHGETTLSRNLMNGKMDTAAAWSVGSTTDYEFVDKGTFHVPGWTGDTLLRLTAATTIASNTGLSSNSWRAIQWDKYYAMSIWVRTEQPLLSTDFYTVFTGPAASDLPAPLTWYSVKRETLPGNVQRFTISGKIPILTMDRQRFIIRGRAHADSPMDIGPMMHSGPHNTEAEALAAVENYFDGDSPNSLDLLPWTPKVNFDNPESRVAEYGVDRGILYLNDDVAVPWNGLIRVSENIDGVDIEPYYVDGVKRLDVPSTFEIEGEIEAYSAPREFAAYVGEAEIAPGFYGSNQMPKPFCVSYRTKIGGQSESKHYKIHILYNVLAQPSDKEYNTIGEDTDPTVFTWEFKTTPQVTNGIRSSLFTLDSREISVEALAIIESRLYGYDQDEPDILTPDEIAAVIADYPL